MRKSMSSPPAASGSVQQAMSKLTAQWYNAVTSAFNLDPTQFQLLQGNVPVGDTSEALWSIVDVVPPLSLNNYYNPSQLDRFSQDYGSVIENLIADSGGNFQADMGDYYEAWKKYISQQKSPGTPQTLQLFKTWSVENMNTTEAEKCYADLEEAFSGPIAVALDMWSKAGSKTKAYDNTIDQLKTQLDSQKSVSFTMDSSKQSSDLSHTWANGEVAGLVEDIFEGAASATYNQITSQMTQAGILIQAEFQHFYTFPLAPLAEPSNDPELKNYEPWYNSAALALAYHTKDNTIWDAGSPKWEDAFGPKGMMLRICSALVIVDGINITMASDAAFSKAQQTMFESSTEVGFWPFFAATVNSGWSHSASFTQQGSITVTQKCPAGNPNVLGALVVPIATSLG